MPGALPTIALGCLLATAGLAAGFGPLRPDELILHPEVRAANDAAGAAPPDPELERRAQTQARLAALKAELAELDRRLEATDDRLAALQRELRAADLAIAQSIRGLTELERRRAQAEAERERLAIERRARQADLARERLRLATLLRSAYALGRMERVKLALGERDVSRITRVLAYHDYLNRARVESIAAVHQELSTLAETDAAYAAVGAEIDGLIRAAAEQRSALGAQREERRQLVERLSAQLADDRIRRDSVARDQRLLERLLRALSAAPDPSAASLSPFAQRRGKLPWPLAEADVRGVVPRSGDAPGQAGWILRSAAGTPVRAIAHGRVAFADWLRGLGLLVIIDHGGGYLSLYGNCESVLRSEGDWVEAGEPIATTGRSGALSIDGLYLELRRRTTTLDPKLWLARRR